MKAADGEQVGGSGDGKGLLEVSGEQAFRAERHGEHERGVIRREGRAQGVDQVEALLCEMSLDV